MIPPDDEREHENRLPRIYYRPASPYAAHVYGPMLLAGAEVFSLSKGREFEINDVGVVQ